MVITVQSQGERYELKLQGRLDANWADLVAKAIEAAIRAGHHDLDLDFSEVSYVSSAGIRVLLKYSKQLKAARGTLRVVRPTAAVLSVIRLSGLSGILLAPAAELKGSVSGPPATTTSSAAQTEPRRWQREGVEFESYEVGSGGDLEGLVVGRPEAFAMGQLSAKETQPLRCADNALAVGLAAFGSHRRQQRARLSAH